MDAATTIPVANPQAIDQSGTYYIKLTNSTTGCAVIAAVQVSIHPIPALTVGVSDTVLCAPATIDLTSPAIIRQRDQGAQYALTFWMDPAFTIPVPDPRAVNQSGTYYIRLANTGTGCGTVAAIQVSVHPQPVLTLTATSPSCNGADNGSIIPTPSNGTAPYQYSSDGGLSWQDTIGNNLPAGTYSILTRDSYGCISQAVPAVLTDPPLLMLWEEVSAHANVPCHGASEGQLLFTAAGGANGYRYTISSTATGDISNNSGLFTGLPAGDYTVIVTDASQCSRQITTAILEPPPLSIALVSKTDLDCENQPRGSISFTAKGGQPPYWFRIGESGWQRDSVFTGLLAGTYLLTVRDGNECVTAPLSTEIFLEEGCDVVFPSAFTPNGDGLNDLFRPKYYSRVSDYRLTVYNRWGAIIFQSNDAAQGWNGQFKGVLMDTGTYVWVATFVNRRGQPQTMKGTITLVK
jgi:gliding motility-associated-like protein